MGNSLEPSVREVGRQLTPWLVLYTTILVLSVLWFLLDVSTGING
jgi:hypothetical protein